MQIAITTSFFHNIIIKKKIWNLLGQHPFATLAIFILKYFLNALLGDWGEKKKKIKKKLKMSIIFSASKT